MYKVLWTETTDNLFSRGRSALVLIGRQHYWFDLRDTPDAGVECMGFTCNKDGDISCGRDVYCRRGGPVSTLALMECIKEFAEELENG